MYVRKYLRNQVYFIIKYNINNSCCSVLNFYFPQLTYILARNKCSINNVIHDITVFMWQIAKRAMFSVSCSAVSVHRGRNLSAKMQKSINMRPTPSSYLIDTDRLRLILQWTDKKYVKRLRVIHRKITSISDIDSQSQTQQEERIMAVLRKMFQYFYIILSNWIIPYSLLL